VIVATSLNSAMDVTYTVAALVLGKSHRVSSVRSRAGGKGINVARVMRQLGDEEVVAGLRGGRTGAAITNDLAAGGRTATVFNEPGPPSTTWPRLTWPTECASSRTASPLRPSVLRWSAPR